jgi:hypothetical protein
MSSEEFNENKSPLNLVAYPARDFNTNFDFLQRRMKEKFAGTFNDFVRSSEGIMLVHLFSYGLAQLNWYLARQASDTFLDTSRTDDAVARHASQLGYKVRGAAASSGDLTLTFDATSVDAIIPKGFKFSGPRSLVLEATAEVFVGAGSTSATVSVTEGVSSQLTFTSDGLENQVFRLTGASDGSFVAYQNVQVSVNGFPWTESPFLTFDKTDQFEVDYTSDPPVVRTGDGSAGNIPADGVEVFVQYRRVSGSAGSIQESGPDELITASDTFLVDGAAVPVVVSAPDGIVGGSDPESRISVKKNAAGYFGSRGVAITTTDYQSLVNSFADATFGAVSQGYAAVVRESGNDSTTTTLTDSIVQSIALLDNSASSAQVAVDTSQTAIDADTVAVTDASAAATTSNTAISESSTAVLGEAQSLNSQGNIVEGNVASIEDIIVSLDAAIDASSATPVDKDLMKGQTKRISDLLSGTNGISNAASVVKASSGTLTAESDSITTETTSITASLAAIDTGLASVGTQVGLIDTETSELASSTTATRTSIDADVNSLLLHLSELFDESCRSNVVNVPILSTNSDGFYTGPSSGLIAAVQSYLDGIKELTQQVVVVSGASALIPAVISVKVGLESSLVESDVIAAVGAAVDLALKGRAFNSPLKLSELYDIVDATNGVTFSNIEITGPTDRLDSDGNLVPLELEIVTKGSVTIMKAAS